MRSSFDDYDTEASDLERRLDRDLEREGGYRSPHRRALNPRGTVRARFDAGVLQPPVKIGGRS